MRPPGGRTPSGDRLAGYGAGVNWFQDWRWRHPFGSRAPITMTDFGGKNEIGASALWTVSAAAPTICAHPAAIGAIHAVSVRTTHFDLRALRTALFLAPCVIPTSEREVKGLAFGHTSLGPNCFFASNQAYRCLINGSSSYGSRYRLSSMLSQRRRALAHLRQALRPFGLIGASNLRSRSRNRPGVIATPPPTSAARHSGRSRFACPHNSDVRAQARQACDTATLCHSIDGLDRSGNRFVDVSICNANYG